MRGNILQNSESFGTNTYQYTSPRPHAVTQIGDQRFDYDDNGNMTSDPSRRMFYNANNQLIRVEMQNGNVIHYDYDYTGARVSKRAVTRDPLRRTTTTTTHYLGDALEIKGDQITLNVFAGSRKVATRTIGTVSSLTGTGGGTLVDNGIDPEVNLTLVMPYLLVFFVLFLLGSLRPVPVWVGARFIAPGRNQLRPYIDWICNIYHFWKSWTDAVRETIGQYPQHALSKSFLLFMILLFQFQPMSLLFADDDTPRFPHSDPDYFYYVHDDHLGSSALLTEGKPTARHSGIIYNRGDLLQRFEYAPFGKETFVLNPNLQFDPSYTGQKYDVETGLYYYKSRYYNPILGRFIQPDTVVPDAKNLQAYNRYTYVNNNPLKYVDPSGHAWYNAFWNAFKAFVSAFIQAFITVILTPFIGPTLAGAVGAFFGGLTYGLLSGSGIKASLIMAKDNAISALENGGISLFTGAYGIYVAVRQQIEVSLNAIRGNWEGLLVYSAGLAGSAAGTAAGNSVVEKIQTAQARREANYGTGGPNVEAGEDQALVNEIQKNLDNIDRKLGTYRDPSKAGIYRDDPLIYQDKDMKLGGIGETFTDLRPDSLSHNLANGSIMQGSQRIMVWGSSQNQGSSWIVHRYQNIGSDISGQINRYGWVPMSHSDAINTDIVERAINHLR